ncbi:unnamed protein product [Dicrocoelium dendriticum]|nr:unnamed protein product [Dicrocoelium dendriticum]
MDPTKRALREESKHYNQPSNSTTAFAESCGFKYLTAQPVPTTEPKSYTPIGNALQDARGLQINLLNMPTYVRRDISTDGETSTTLEASDFELTQLRKRHLSDISVDVGRWSGDKNYRLLTTRMDPRQYHDRAWCSDTPGFVCSDQILNYLPVSELSKIESGNPYGSRDRARLQGCFGNVGKVLIPRNFVMRPGLSLLLGRLGRLDVMQAPGPVYFTTFSFLPVHIVEQSDVDEYMEKHAAILGPGHRPSDASDAVGPFGTLPPFDSRVLEPIEAQSNLDSSAADVVLSGAGWISVAGLIHRRASRYEEDEATQDNNISGVATQFCDDSKSVFDPDSNIHLCAWTPGALGISVRKPALIPDVIRRRKRRFFMTREFSISA